jgi:hypothetical protein
MPFHSESSNSDEMRQVGRPDGTEKLPIAISYTDTCDYACSRFFWRTRCAERIIVRIPTGDINKCFGTINRWIISKATSIDGNR